MRLRTLEDLQEAIDSELAWRKHELSTIKANIQNSRQHAKKTALRSGITLLYAHWEGSIKSIASTYLEFVLSCKHPYRELSPNFLALALHKEITQFYDSKRATVHTSFIKAFNEKLEEKSRPILSGAIRTESNLNSDVFAEIMVTLGLDTSFYEGSYNLIDATLLKMRNSIAHGEKLETLSLDESRYNEIHIKIIELIDNFSTQVSNSATLKTYLIETR